MALRNGAADEVLGTLYPFQDRTVHLSTGHHMHYMEMGRAGLRRPTFLLLHGSPAWSLVWRRFMRPLARAGRVVAVDHIGFGRSDHPSEASYHSLDRHVRNLEELAGALRLKRVIPVLHGWGGPFGLGYAVRRPEDLLGIVALNTWVTGDTGPRTGGGRRALDSFWPGRADRRVARRIRRGTSRPVPEDVLEAYRHPFPTRAGRVAVAALDRMVPRGDDHPDRPTMDAIAQDIGGLEVPARILWGERDRTLGPQAAEALHRRLARAEPVRTFQAGHFLQEDIPEALVAEILAFAKGI